MMLDSFGFSQTKGGKDKNRSMYSGFVGRRIADDNPDKIYTFTVPGHVTDARMRRGGIGSPLRNCQVPYAKWGLNASNVHIHSSKHLFVFCCLILRTDKVLFSRNQVLNVHCYPFAPSIHQQATTLFPA